MVTLVVRLLGRIPVLDHRKAGRMPPSPVCLSAVSTNRNSKRLEFFFSAYSDTRGYASNIACKVRTTQDFVAMTRPRICWSRRFIWQVNNNHA
jgi:hypothetical protein